MKKLTIILLVGIVAFFTPLIVYYVIEYKKGR